MALVVEMESLSGQSSFSPLEVVNDGAASGGQYVEWPHGGSHQVLSTPSDGASGQVLITFVLSETADVQFDFLVDFPTADDDSFYYKMDAGSWNTQNNVTTTGFETLTITTFTSLAAGVHTLRILRRENGARLDRVTLTESAGTISEPASEGSAAITLADATVSGVGALAIDGSAGVTTADVTAAAAATLALAGSASITLDSVSVAAAGELPIDAAAAVTLGDTTAAGAGELTLSGQSAITLDSVTASGAGEFASISGSASITLDDATASSAATLALSGELSVALDGATAAATGELTIAGAAPVSLEGLSVSGAGGITLSGQAAITLDAASTSATSELAIEGATGGVGGTAASIGHTRAAAITAGGPTQDITISGFGTPDAVIVRYVEATTDDVVVGDAAFGAGVFDGVAPVCTFTASRAGGASSDSGRGNDFSGNWFIRAFGVGGADSARADVSFITDGIRLDWDLLPPAGWLMTFTLIKGTELAHCGYVDNSAGDVDVTTAGGQPNFILTFGGDTGSFPASNFEVVEGYCVEDGGVVTQGSMSWWEGHNSSNCSPMVVFDTGASKRVMFGGGLIGGIIWGDFDANGATAQRVGVEGCDALYLMLKFPAGQEVGIFSDSVTTSTGNTTIGPGGSVVPAFIQGCFAALTPAMDDTWRGSSGDPEAGVVSTFSYDGTTQICNTLFLDEGSDDPIDTNSVSRSGSVFDSADDDEANAWVGTASAFTAGGMTVNITTAPATERRIFGWYLAAESGSAIALDDMTAAGVGALALVGSASVQLDDATSAATGALPIAGDASVILDDTSVTAAGELPLTGQASIELDAVAASGAGEAPGLEGSLAVTLGDVVASGAGALGLAGSASVALDDVTASAAAEIAISADGAVTLDSVTAAAEGTLPLAAEAAIALDDAATAATATLALVGSSSVQLGDVTVAAEGTSGSTGEAAITLGDVAASGAATISLAGSASVTLDDVTTPSAAELDITGEASVQLGDVTVAGAGALALTGTASVTLDDTALSSAAALALTGSASLQLDAVTVSAEGTSSLLGEGAIALDDVSAAGTGVLPIAAASSVALDDVSASGTGVLPIDGQAAIQLDGATAGSSSEIDLSGSASIALGGVTASGSGSLDISGESSIALDAVTLIATGGVTETRTGSGVITLGDVSLAAASELSISGQSAVALDDVTVSAAVELRLGAHASIQLDSISVSSASQLSIAGVAGITLGDITTATEGGAIQPVVFTNVAALADPWQLSAESNNWTMKTVRG